MLLYNAQEPTDFESYQEQGDIGFLSVAGAQFDTFKYEDLSTSRGRNLDEELLKEVHKVHDLAPEMFGPSFLPAFESSSTEILKESWRQATQGNIGMLQGGLQLALANSIASTKSKDSLSSDWQGIIEPNLEALRERFPDANIRNRDEIDADIAAQAKMLRDDFEETYSYADPYAAFFGTLGGGAVASMADPINIMTLPIGAGKVAGASFVQGLSIIVARSFGIGFATEAAIQPLVYDYKKEIESPYDLQDALFNMSAAGVGNGLLNGLGHSIARGFDRITSKQELPDNHETRRLRKKIQDLLELQDFTDETGAKTVGELEVHLKALNTAMADIEAGRQVDYDSLGKTIEAEYLELFDVEVNGARATMDYIAQKRYELEESFDPDLYAKQEQLQKFADQKLTKWELKQAQNKADIETTGELNQETDLDAIREIQKADFDRSVGEDTIRQNEEANIANNDLRASRRDEGDMIALKQQMDDLDNKYSEQVDYHSAAKKARDQYVVDKAEETNQAIAVAPTDTPRMMAVKTAVNRIAASMGANDIKVRVYEGNPELDGDMRFSVDDGEGSAAWKAAEAKGLDMSQEGRMARAKAMGFGDRDFYHATGANIREFDNSKIGSTTDEGWFGRGHYFTPSKDYVNQFVPSTGNANVLPIKLKADNQYDWRANETESQGRGMAIANDEMRQLKTDQIKEAGYTGVDVYDDVVQLGEDEVLNPKQWEAVKKYYVNKLGSFPQWLKKESVEKTLRKGSPKWEYLEIYGPEFVDAMPQKRILKERMIFDTKNIRSKFAAFDPDLIDSPNLRYSMTDGVAVEDRMITVHNIGPESVIHADELGGLPAPSVAVVKASVGLDNFGDITLVAHPDMIDPKKSRKNRIFNADVYSPRYPNVSYKVNRRLFDSLTQELDEVAEKNGFPYAVTHSGVESGGLKEFTESWLVAYRYLETIGEAPEIKTKDDGQVVLYGARNEVKDLMTDERNAGFSKWIKDSFSEMITSEKIFAGYGADGSRKYKAHTLNNVVKHMTKDLRGGEDWKGPGQLRAYAAKEFKSISDIQSSRNSLVDEETMLDIKGDINLRVEDLIEQLKPFYKFDSNSFGFMDAAIENLQEFVQTGRLQDFAELPDDILKSVDALVSDLRELPSSYFEAKIQRSVGLDEFKVALVPSEANFNEAAKVLARNGVEVIRHASSDSKAKAMNSLDELMFSKQGNTIEAAINPETGELHINASAFRDEAHLMQVMREEIIGHYGLRKSLGGDFQGVINDIKSTALTNPELRQMWVDLSGIDPQTRQIINPNAPYKGMADDVIADEIISKMAREEVSDTTFMALKNIIIKALRKIGLVKDDITISEMRALVVKSEQALKKNVVKKPTITGMKPQLKQIDEPLNNEAIDAEAARIVSDETTDQVIFDQNGNTINLRDALMEDDNDIAGIESIRVCML